jgi:hypothetical protein
MIMSVLKQPTDCYILMMKYRSGVIQQNEVMSSPGQTKDYKIGICCFYSKHAALRRKSKALTGWLEIRIMCPEWSDMSTRGLLFQ